MAKHTMTASRKAALRKAQLASAAKRKGKGSRKKYANQLRRKLNKANKHDDWQKHFPKQKSGLDYALGR